MVKVHKGKKKEITVKELRIKELKELKKNKPNDLKARIEKIEEILGIE